MKRIWIVSELFYPDETSTAYILTKVAEALTVKFDVNVICGPRSYSFKNDNVETSTKDTDIPGVKIYRVSETSLDKNKLITRIIRFLMLSFKLSRKLYASVQKGEPVLIVTNPAPILLIISIIKRIKKFPLYILVHDVFPENTVPAGIISSPKSVIYRILKCFFDSAYRSADKLIVLGRDMQDVILRKLGNNKNRTQVAIIENWAQNMVRPNHKSIEQLLSVPKIDLQYAGNVGRVQGLQNLVKIFYSVNNSDIRLSIWGDGAVKGELEKYVNDNNVNNVIFWRSYSREEQNMVLNNCDLAIVTLADGMYGLGVPSKSYNIMAAGKPILFIGDLNSEIALMIKEYGIGYCFDSKDINGISAFLISLHDTSREDLYKKGIKARQIAETNFSEKEILKKFLNEIQ